jgi:salicylate hydroxylase
MTMKVAIIGGGLGGLAAAIALRRHGISAQVYERARELRAIGAGLTVAPNGLKALAAIEPGIVARLLELGSQNRRFQLRKAGGELITALATTYMDRYRQPALNILWSNLQQTLAGFLPPDSIHLGHRLIGFEPAADTLALHFDGRDPVAADLVVGADGINSAVRQAIINDGPPRYAGRLSWRGVIRCPHPSLLPDEVTFFAGEGKNFAVFDVGGGLTFWSATVLWPDPPVPGDAATVRSRVTEAFADWAAPIPEILAAMPPEDIVERPIEDRTPLTHWSSGPVTLLGDAAHAMVPSLGQGANTAFEDAWELSQSLASQPNIEAALLQYEKSRIPRTQVIHARSADQGSRYYEADNEVFSRSILERATAGQREFEDWIYDYTP